MVGIFISYLYKSLVKAKIFNPDFQNSLTTHAGKIGEKIFLLYLALC